MQTKSIFEKFPQHEYELPITIYNTTDFKIQKKFFPIQQFPLASKIHQNELLHNSQVRLTQVDFSIQTNSPNTNQPDIQKNGVRETREKNPSEKG
jgi:hypothetical protein